MNDNVKCIRIHEGISTIFFKISSYYNIDFKYLIAIQYLSYDNLGGK